MPEALTYEVISRLVGPEPIFCETVICMFCLRITAAKVV